MKGVAAMRKVQRIPVAKLLFRDSRSGGSMRWWPRGPGSPDIWSIPSAMGMV